MSLMDNLVGCVSFVVENLDKFWRNSDVHSWNTGHKYDCNMPNFSLTDCLKGVYRAHFQLFSNLPSRNRRLNHGLKLFRPAVKEYLLSHSCDRVDEFTSTESSYMVYENTCNILSGLPLIDLCSTLCLLSVEFLIVFRIT
jgi:NAD(P)H-nitrite reductase large subunit